jgi:hypothetical protein
MVTSLLLPWLESIQHCHELVERPNTCHMSYCADSVVWLSIVAALAVHDVL